MSVQVQDWSRLIPWLVLGLVVVATLVGVGLGMRRRARREHALMAGLRALGSGDLRRRLDDDEAGLAVASCFNQAARDLEARAESVRRALSGLRRLGTVLPGQVLIHLDGEASLGETLGDIEALTGHAPLSLLGRHATFLFVSEGDWEQLVGGLGDGAAKVSRILPLRRADGEVVLVHAELRGAGGAEGYVLGLAPDGGRAAEQERLQGVDARARALASGLADGVAVLVDGRIVSVNEPFAGLLDETAPALTGRPFVSLIAAHDLVHAAGALTRDSGPHEVDLAFKRRGGDEALLAATFGRTTIDGVAALVVAVRDVTQRRDRERRLRLSGAWLDAALEATPDGVAALGAPEAAGPWPVALANGAFLRMLALPADRLPTRAELEARLDAAFVDAEGVRALLRGVEGDPAAGLEAAFETRDQPPRTLEVISTPVRDASGGVAGRLLVLRDATARRALERRLRADLERLVASRTTLEQARGDVASANAGLTARLDELARLNRELRELDDMKSNLLANVSHELQTPLVSIKGYTDMLLRGDLGPLTEEQRQGLGVTLRNIERLIGLIDQLVAFSREQEKLAELTLEPFPIWQVIEETIQLLGDRIRERGLKVTTRYRTDRLGVRADRNLVSQVLINLIGNAIKFNREQGEVMISVRAGSRDDLVVEVRDTGVGIPRDEQERVFERGFRATTAAGTRGSGIGLALVREILRRHGCQIRLDSRPGEGSTFSFTLPIAPAAGSAGDGGAAATGAGPGDAGTPDAT